MKRTFTKAAVAAALAVPAEKILFIDDREENVEGARRVGFQAECCRRSPDDLVIILTHYGVL